MACRTGVTRAAPAVRRPSLNKFIILRHSVQLVKLWVHSAFAATLVGKRKQGTLLIGNRRVSDTAHLRVESLPSRVP